MEVGVNYSTQQFCCLFTKMKTQKRKIWQDGRLVITGTSVCLYDAHPSPGTGDAQFDQTELSGPQLQSLLQRLETRIETDKFLIQIEGPWQVASRTSSLPMSAVPLVSKGMHKVMARKFQKPGSFVPPNPMEQQQQQQQQQNLGKRLRAPLQPGDLTKRYYGTQQTMQPELGTAWNQLQPRSGFNPPGSFPLDNVSEARQTCQQGSVPEKVGPSNRWSSRAQQTASSPPNQWNVGPPLSHQQPQNLKNPNQWSTATSTQPRPPQDSWSSASRQSLAQTNNQYGTQPFEDPQTDHPAPLTVAAEKEYRKKQWFVSNGFNADTYYGEEEESGDEDDAPDQFQWNQHVRPPAEMTTEPDDKPNPFQVPSRPPMEPPTNPPAPPLDLPTSSHQKHTAENASGSLSRNQLLALLGGGKESEDSQADVAQETTQQSVASSLVEASKDGSIDDRDNPKQQAFEFVLQSASDSSFDETEDESQHSIGVV
jgi:Protein of unknown function (DUF2439)